MALIPPSNGNGNSSGNAMQLVVTLLAAAGLLLFQYAILDRLNSQQEAIGQLSGQVSGLVRGGADDDKELDAHQRAIEELQRICDQKHDRQINELMEELRAKRFALQHEREHARHETKALTDEIVNGAVKGMVP